MTSTYDEHLPTDKKIAEELRCIRCVLERLLRTKDETLFVDYQMEKFGEDYKTKG
jgi:hypothetical protein